MAMGDDAVSRVDIPLSDYVRSFEDQLGITLTDVVQATPEDFEFCSHRFLDGKAQHLRPMKALAKIVCCGAGDFITRSSRRASLKHEWRHTPGRDAYLNILDILSPVEEALAEGSCEQTLKFSE